MAAVDGDRIQAVLDDAEFQKLRQIVKDKLAASVLSAATRPDVRDAKLAELHALVRLEAIMQQAAKGKI